MTLRVIHDPKHWRNRAAEMRSLAMVIEDDQTREIMNHSISQTATYFFNSLLSCSLSRGSAQFFTPPPRIAPIVSAHSRRQDPKTPVEQALMRGLGTA